jgi:hypothetical protein
MMHHKFGQGKYDATDWILSVKKMGVLTIYNEQEAGTICFSTKLTQQTQLDTNLGKFMKEKKEDYISN